MQELCNYGKFFERQYTGIANMILSVRNDSYMYFKSVLIFHVTSKSVLFNFVKILSVYKRQ